MRIPAHPTPQSIAAAKAAQQQERAKFEAETGISLTDDGRQLGLRIANEIAAAVYGVRGAWRETVH